VLPFFSQLKNTTILSGKSAATPFSSPCESASFL